MGSIRLTTIPPALGVDAYISPNELSHLELRSMTPTSLAFKKIY